MTIPKDILANYSIVWGLIALDIVLKILIREGFPVYFDYAVTMTAIAMRSRANLQFGLEMQNIFKENKTALTISRENLKETSAISNNVAISMKSQNTKKTPILPFFFRYNSIAKKI